MRIFLKLGGSLITDKSTPNSPRLESIQRLAEEIARARAEHPDLELILGHGSGSFGHAAASRYGTRQGVDSPEKWRGFAEVWYAASSLNRLVMEALHTAGLPAIAFSACSAVTARAGQIAAWDLKPIQSALAHGLLPVVYGDVVFDQVSGGSICSTEDIFTYLSAALQPERILIAGIEPGVWADYPTCTRLVEELTPASAARLSNALSGSAQTDVTGGMRSKVNAMLSLLQTQPGLQEVLIFSGTHPQAVYRALCGASPGTALRRASENAI